MRKLLLLPLMLAISLGAFGQASPYNLNVFKAQSFTATGQTGATIQLNGLVIPSTVGSSYASGTITLTGVALTTVSFQVLGSSDNGVTFYPLPIYTAASPTTTPATTITATAAGLYQINLAGISHIKFVTTGTFTATSISLTLTGSPNALVSRNGSGGGGSGTVNSGSAGQIAYYIDDGTAVNGTNALPNGITATTQTTGDSSTKVATDAFVIANQSGFTAGGDLSGTSSSQTVTGIQGHALPTLVNGYPHWNGSAWVYDTPSGVVSSVFGRTGAVIPVSGDYSYSQVTGAAGVSGIPVTGNCADWATPTTLGDTGLPCGGGGSNSVQYNASNTTYYIVGDSIAGVSSSCVETALPSDTATITAGTVSAGVLTATANNTYSSGCVVTLSGFTGSYTGLNGQIVTISATGLSGTQFEVPVTAANGSTGTGQARPTYNLTGYLSREPYINGHGTVINDATSNQTIAQMTTAYATTAHLHSPAVTGNPGFLLIFTGTQDLYNGQTLSQMESDIQTYWQTARADNWTGIIQITIPGYHFNSSPNAPISQWAAFNSWLKAQGPTSANVTAGKYWDRIVDLDALIPDGFDPNYIQQSGAIGHLTDMGAKVSADQINEAFGVQGTNLQGAACATCAYTDTANTFTQDQTLHNLILLGACTGCIPAPSGYGYWYNGSANPGAPATPSVVQAKAANITLSLAYSSNVTSGNLLVVVIGDGVSNISSATASDTLGTSWSSAIVTNGANDSAKMFYGLAPASGADTVTIAGYTNTGRASMAILEASNLQAVLDGTPVGATGNVLSPGSLTTTQDNSFAVVGMFDTVNAGWTPPAGWTLTQNNSGFNEAVGIADHIQAAAGTVNPTFTATGNVNSLMLMAAFKAKVGVPAADNSFYFDSTTHHLFGPSAAGSWPSAPISNLPLGGLYSAAGTALPSCASGNNGQEATVSDATSPTYMGAYTSGGGITAAVICSFDGTSYTWKTH